MQPVPGFPSTPEPPTLTDGAGRLIDHLRLSLTDNCNLACRYCTKENGPSNTHSIEADFATELVRWLSQQHGIRHVRLTGGEPLLYPELIPLITQFSTWPTLDEVTLTTNGQALAHQARNLYAAGLVRVNISLDTLDPDRFVRVTGGGKVNHTLCGIESCAMPVSTPVRINVVVQRGFNDDEVPTIAQWGLSCGCVVRFLEAMPIGPFAHIADKHLVPASEIIERLTERFELRPIPGPPGQPAMDYAARMPGLQGVIGVIASTTRPFCSSCRRLRVTSRGQLLTCLFDNEGVNLKDAWDGHTLNTGRANAILLAAVKAKSERGQRHQTGCMMSIGG